MLASMPATSSTTSTLTDTITQAAAVARDNPYVKELVGKQLNKKTMALTAAKVGGKVISNRRAARKGGAAPATGDAPSEAPEQESKKSPAEKRPAEKKKRGSGRLVFLVITAVAVGLFANKGTREQILDTLFGAEEEFEYESTTTSVAAHNGNH